MCLENVPPGGKLSKMFCFKNGTKQGNWFVWLGVLSLLFTTLLSSLFPFKYFSYSALTKVGNIDVAGGVRLLLSFLLVHGARIMSCHLCFWY